MIHFVGAGCGAADLITVRGMNLLKEADCVIYAGSLVSKDLLGYCKKNARIHDSAYLDLDQVIQIMLEEEAAGQIVVRLHTGDPSLYGAIGEQMRILDERGIVYDVTPGVTAAFGAAASLGLEMTLPGITQTLIFTRVEGRTPMPQKESIEALSKAQATMAVYLSATRVEELRRQLLKGGYKKTTPVAVCYKVSWPDEKIWITSVDEMVALVKEKELTLTTLFIIGDVIGAKDFDKSKLYDGTFSTCFREGKAP